MTSIELRTPRVGPAETLFRPDDTKTPRSSPAEWARRRRAAKGVRRETSNRDRALRRLRGLSDEWYLIEGATLGIEGHHAFVAIGPGGVFAVTVRSQGRSRVRLSGDTLQINGRRPPYIPQARALANAVSAAFTRTAGTEVPVVPVLALTGSGLITIYGVPRGCVVMPYRELDNLLRAYGDRIGPRTVDKLASIARHPTTSVDIASEEVPARNR